MSTGKTQTVFQHLKSCCCLTIPQSCSRAAAVHRGFGTSPAWGSTCVQHPGGDGHKGDAEHLAQEHFWKHHPEAVAFCCGKLWIKFLKGLQLCLVTNSKPFCKSFAKLPQGDLLKCSFKYHQDKKRTYSTQPGEILIQSHYEKAKQ